MAFNPDEFLAETIPPVNTGGFDPDAFLASTQSTKQGIDTSKGRAAYMAQFPKDEISQRKSQNEYEREDAKKNVESHANLVKGALAGASSIPLSALKAIRFINPLDSIDNKSGSELAMDQFREENKDSGAFAIGDIGAKMAGTAGVGGGMAKVVGALSQSPKALALAEALRTSGLGTQAAGLPTRIAAGATVGGASDFMTGGDGITGMAIGGALPIGQAVATPAVSKIYDLLTGSGIDVRGSKVMKDVAGDKLAKIKELLANNSDDVSAIQSAEPAGSTRFSALGKRAERVNSEYFSDFDKVQEAKRLALLESVMPDEAAATAARSAAADPLYKAAREGGDVVDSAPVVRKISDLLKSNPGNTELVRELTKIKSGLIDGYGNYRTNAEQVSSVMDGIKASVANKENKFILGNLLEIKDDIAKAIPNYQSAQKKFAEMSPPVNQSKVIQAMTDVMKKSTGGERVAPFLDVMGRGESALLKRADQSARFGGIEDVLTTEQIGARNKVAAEMLRDANIDKLASKGTEDLAATLKKDAFHTTIPNYISWKLSAAKRGLDIAEEHLNEKTMKRIYEAMKTPKGALDLINTLPADEKVKAIKLLKEMNNPVITPALSVNKDNND